MKVSFTNLYKENLYKSSNIHSEILFGLRKTLYLGNLDSKRDWGHAKDYVKMQWLMLQQKTPKDYVIATGKISTVREFLIKSANDSSSNNSKKPGLLIAPLISTRLETIGTCIMSPSKILRHLISCDVLKIP